MADEEHQERFDDLVRTLVTQLLSRWQVLKTLGAAMIAGLAQPLLLSVRVATAQGSPCNTAADCPGGRIVAMGFVQN